MSTRLDEKLELNDFLVSAKIGPWHHGAALPELEALAGRCADRYAQVFLCPDDFAGAVPGVYSDAI